MVASCRRAQNPGDGSQGAGALQAWSLASAKCAVRQRYTGKPFAHDARETVGEAMAVQMAVRGELHPFSVIPLRWVLKRSLG